MNNTSIPWPTQREIRESMSFSAIVDINGISNPKTGGFHVAQDAIDAGHKSIFVRDGTYPGVAINKNNVTLVGENKAGVVFDGGTADYGLYVSGDNCTVQNVCCRTTAGGGSVHDAVYLTGTNRCRLMDIHIDQSDDYGMMLTSPTNSYLQIARVYVTGCDNCGIYFHDAASATLIDSFIFSNGGNGLNGNSPFVRVSGCSVYSNTAEGIAFNLGNADNSVIHGNVVVSNGTYGILIGTNDENCVIVGNRVGDNPSGEITDNSGTSTQAGNDTT